MPTVKQAQNANQTIRQRVEAELAENGNPLEVEAVQTKDKVNGKAQPDKVSEETLSSEQNPNSRKFNASTDDFFDYICATVTPGEWESGRVYLYLYKKAQTGNVHLDRLFRPITIDEFRDTYVSKNGPGDYLLQFTSRLKTLSSCSKWLTFTGNGQVAADGGGNALGAGAYGALPGTNAAINSLSGMLEHGAKTAIEISKQESKGVDVAALMTGIAALMPKNDNTFLITMLENQRKEATDRAEREVKAAQERLDRQEKENERREKEARDYRERELKAAEDRAERDAKFFQQLQSQSDKFTQLLLAEKDKKAEDSFGLLDALKDIVKTVVMDRIEGGPEAPQMKGWMGLIDRLAPAITQLAGPLASKMSGIPLPPMPTQPNPAQPQNPANGQAQLAIPTTEQMVSAFAQSLAIYLHSREPQRYNLEHWVETAFEQYEPVSVLIGQVSKEQIVGILKQNPIGVELFTAADAGMFLDSLIDAIKNSREGEETEPESPVVDIPNPKGRKQKPV